MDDRELHELLGQVKAGRLSRRSFVTSMLALGLTAPMVSQMLASAGLAQAQSRAPEFTPTKRGGGGPVKILLWQAPTLLNPHFATGTKDQIASRVFYEPLASYDPDGNIVPTLAAEVPSLAERPGHQGWAVGHLAAQEERGLARRQALHRRRRRLQLGIRDGSGDRRPHGRALPGHRAHRQARQPHREGRLQEPHPVLVVAVLRRDRDDRPQASVRGVQRRQVARGADQSQARRDRRLQVRGLQAGRHRPRRDQRQLPRPQPAVLRSARAQGRRRRRLGRSRGHPDRGVRLRLESAGGGRHPQAAGAGRQGPGGHRPHRQHRAHPAQQQRPVDRGGRRARLGQEQASLPSRPHRSPGPESPGGPGFGAGADLRAHRDWPRPTSSTPPTSSARRTPASSSASTRPISFWTRPAGSVAATASGPKTASGSSSCSRPPSTPLARRTSRS